MKQTSESILFASDLTPEMKQVFHHAATQALSRNAQIIILHVMKDGYRTENQISLLFGKEQYQVLKDRKRQTAQKTLIGKDIEGHRIRQAIAGFFGEQGLVQEAPSLIKDILVKEGRSIADEIIETAVKEDCGMIVMGCRKQGAIASAMGDQINRKILKRSKIPVLVVPFSGN